ncbi:hypothetical protein KP509_28G043900 [Ceratopteris richardii]|uniref:Microtubule-associated protein TORTIFOLIA1 n=1 Tax=Ceratopteris richardii TaxID=49495 RepID=A0A8T2RDU6_CERRI|nr:hypothetical protein KP509_28G043900 [Ceratopteris richardii]
MQVGGTPSHQSLAMVLVCVQECLKSNDWATRKAAAETLACVASTVGLPLGTFKNGVVDSLEACRFDKVKPVRDMVIQTVQVWKRIPGSDSEQEKISTLKESACIEASESQSKKKGENAKDSAISQKHSAYSSSDSESQDGGCFGFVHSKSAVHKVCNDAQKKRALHAEKKSNAPFFSNVERKDTTNWQIDIALPRVLTDSTQSASTMDASKKLMTEQRTYQEHVSEEERKQSCVTREPDSTNTACNSVNQSDINVLEDGGTGMIKSQRATIKHSSCTDSASLIEETEITSWSIEGGVTSSSSSSVNDIQGINSESDSAFIRQKLFHIENQQTVIVELLQNLMSRSDEGLSKLEARIAGVESVIGSLTTDLANAKVFRPQNPSDMVNSKSWKKSETSSFSHDRPRSTESLLSARSGRVSPLSISQQTTGVSTFSDNRLVPGVSPRLSTFYSESHANPWRVHVDVHSESIQRRFRNEMEGLPIVNKNVQDTGSACRLGEGPSARSIWQASKDEATLAAIRGAGDDGRSKLPDSLNSTLGTKLSTAEVKPELAVHKVGGQGKGPFWSLWARAAEFLRSGDVDSAFIEVLCAGDELLLVRLMSRTGPVLEHLSSGTIHELLQTVIQLMLQQSFLDVIIPWIQQVSDLVANNGGDCLGLSLDAKRNIVGSLEETSTLSLSEKWMAATIHELAVHLATAWGLVRAR